MATKLARFIVLSWYICHKHPCKIASHFYQVVCFIRLSEAVVLSVSIKMDKIEYRAVIKLQVILSSSLFHTAVWSRSVVCIH